MNIIECEKKLPLPDLMRKLGDGDAVKRKAKSPLREEKDPSFGVYQAKDGRWRWKDHGNNTGGDAVDYLEAKFGLSRKAAIVRYHELAGVDVKSEAKPGKRKAEKKPAPPAFPPRPPAPPVKRAEGPDEPEEPVSTWKLVCAYSYRNLEGVVVHETLRYVTPSGKKRMRQRQPDPEKAGAWLNHLNGCEPVLYRWPELKAADPSEWVWVVEGEKDADNLAALGLVVTTSVMGAGKWRPHWAWELQGRKVLLVPDLDSPGERHMRDVARSLLGLASEVRVLRWPEVWPEAPEKADVSDWLDVQWQGGAHEPDVLAELREWPGMAGEPGPWWWDRAWEEGREDEGLFARMIAAYHGVIYAGSFFWAWKGGVWRKAEDQEVRGWIHAALRDVGKQKMVTHRDVSSLFQVMKTERFLEGGMSRFNQHAGWLNTRSCMLDARTGDTRRHRREEFSTTQLTVGWELGAEAPDWCEWLAEVQPAEDVRAQLQEIAGYLLVPGNQYEAFFVFFGEGGSGKSTFVKTMKLILGEANCTALPLSELDKGFVRGMMVGKTLYDAGEMTRDSFKHLDLIKSIASGEEIPVDVKHKDPFSFKPQGKIIGTSNVHLKTPDGSQGFWRRFVQIPFQKPRVRGTMIPDYYETFRKELPGILVWAMEGYRRLVAQGHFTQSEQQMRVLGEMAMHINSIPEFLRMVVVEIEGPSDVGRGLTATELFEEYVKWCELESVKQYFDRANEMMREVYRHRPDWKYRQVVTWDAKEGKAIKRVPGLEVSDAWRKRCPKWQA